MLQIQTCQLSDLYLITPKYLNPYLSYKSEQAAVPDCHRKFSNAADGRSFSEDVWAYFCSDYGTLPGSGSREIISDCLLYSGPDGDYHAMAEKRLPGSGGTDHQNYAALCAAIRAVTVVKTEALLLFSDKGEVDRRLLLPSRRQAIIITKTYRQRGTNLILQLICRSVCWLKQQNEVFRLPGFLIWKKRRSFPEFLLKTSSTGDTGFQQKERCEKLEGTEPVQNPGRNPDSKSSIENFVNNSTKFSIELVWTIPNNIEPLQKERPASRKTGIRPVFLQSGTKMPYINAMFTGLFSFL